MMVKGGEQGLLVTPVLFVFCSGLSCYVLFCLGPSGDPCSVSVLFNCHDVFYSWHLEITLFCSVAFRAYGDLALPLWSI